MHPTTASADTSTTGAHASDAFDQVGRRRADIEALRGVAVLVVVLYHAGVRGFSGGYVGVDIFFVISGFVITRVLLDERDRQGGISLVGFYARRFRRILPLSVVALLITLLASWMVLSPVRRAGLADDAQAVSTFSMNLRLVHSGTDYLRAGEAASPLQHYWSLSVEEQFYAIWPVAVALILAATRRRWAVGLAAALLALISLVVSQRLVSDAPVEAYFLLRSRMWQPLVGAALAAFTHRSVRLARPVASTLGAAGMVAMIAAVVTFGSTTPFPGVRAALPVVGAAAFIAAAGHPFGSSLQRGVLPWLGARSYGWYLFHWPAMVLGVAMFDTASPLLVSIAAGIGSLMAADLAHRAIERPLARGKGWRGRSGPLLAGGSALIGLGLAVSFLLAPLISKADATTSSPSLPTTSAPSGLLDLEEVLDTAAQVRRVPEVLDPTLLGAKEALPLIYEDGCHLAGDAVVPPGPCTYGQGDRRVMLFGDSHAAQWFPVLQSMSQADGWALVSRTKSGCAVVRASVSPEWIGSGTFPSCDAWRERTLEEIVADPPDAVIVSVSDTYRLVDGADTRSQEWSDAFVDTLRTIATVSDVILIGDTPRPIVHVPECLSAHPDDATRCVRSAIDAAAAGTEARERAIAASAGAGFMPTLDLLCGRTSCPVVIESVLVYRDASHISPTMAGWLEQPLRARLEALGVATFLPPASG